MTEGLPLDAQERVSLCDLLERLGPDVPTLVAGWTGRDIAAHLLQRERDPIAGPCMVLPGPFQRLAERRRTTLTAERDFTWLVERLRKGPPPGFFRVGWVRSFPSLNEFFVHQEDVRRANDLGPRGSLTPTLEAALWRNAIRGGRYLARRLGPVGLEIERAGTADRETVRGVDPPPVWSANRVRSCSTSSDVRPVRCGWSWSGRRMPWRPCVGPIWGCEAVERASRSRPRRVG